ncbi:hypothetical protein D9756_011440 [Leucocoprinus leucothites]|uniref:Uncharacterized protein n=1 Tax=Leucocoprinus leucothites TaxID=201217 RepID=A0A8H5CLU3_9AGAR|nr:hypothetical protein D9756_011440 [Leucoagaricus leucothites]
MASVLLTTSSAHAPGSTPSPRVNSLEDGYNHVFCTTSMSKQLYSTSISLKSRRHVSQGHHHIMMRVLSLSPSLNHNHAKVVVVSANETGFQFHDIATPNSQPEPLWSKKEAETIQQSGIVTIGRSTSIELEFNGTGIAVIAVLNHFPPIPEVLRPKWDCFLDGTPFSQLPDSSTDHRDKSKHHKQSDIPDDGKTRVCQVKSLEAKNHTLKVDVSVTQLPAFFHSIRYVPLPPATCDDHLDNAIVRIDPQDECLFLSSHKHNWKRGDKSWEVHDPDLSSYLAIQFRGQQLQWFGDLDHGLRKQDIKFFLDGEPTSPKSDHDKSIFTIRPPANNLLQRHSLNISMEKGSLKLDHLLVTTGKPMSVHLQQSNVNSTSSTRTLPQAAIAGAITGSIVGLALLVLAFFLIFRCIRKRRRPEEWKDSALPSLIEHPGSRTSSRSSFSRGFVTGDIEYNPEAQKKMDALDAQPVITRPPSAVILHADSGLRIRFPVSDIPPQYTQI